MKKLLLFLLFVAPFPAMAASPRLPAFPGAEGGGMYATGGRGGRVLYVTRLDDDEQEGSLRWAVTRKYPRTILFRVSGVIRLRKRLNITGGDVTIAGQSAPGDGICIAGFGVAVRADNVVLRYLRFRMGDEMGAAAHDEDALGGRYCRNVLIDHCSISWSTDECASFYANENFTMQWCILSESLRRSLHDKGSHGYGGIWGGKNASFHHNLLASHDSRNPRFDHPLLYLPNVALDDFRGVVDFRNNVIYNWGSNNTYGGEGGHFNLVNNYYKEGPHSPARNRFLTAYAATSLTPAGIPAAYPEVYIDGNRYETRSGTGLTRIEEDNYNGIVWSGAGGEGIPAPPGRVPEFPIGGMTAHTATQPAAEAFLAVVNGAGAWPRDKVDLRAATDARNGTSTGYTGTAEPSKAGLIDSPSQAGGYPAYETAEAPADSDGDGMPDAWELARGLDPSDPADGAAKSLSEAYTNVEIYLHECAAALLREKRINEK